MGRKKAEARVIIHLACVEVRRGPILQPKTRETILSGWRETNIVLAVVLEEHIVRSNR